MVFDELLERNRKWALERTANDPEFFRRVTSQHAPKAYYIGCSDARVPATQLTGTDVGELFVHRNIANQVHPTDSSLSAGLQYAIEALGITEIIVVGHHQCGGVRASLQDDVPSHVEAWINPIRMLSRIHRHELEGLDDSERVDRLVELNVVEQVRTLARHPSVRSAWAAGQPLRIHGSVFDLARGILVPLVGMDRADSWHVAPVRDSAATEASQALSP